MKKIIIFIIAILISIIVILTYLSSNLEDNSQKETENNKVDYEPWHWRYVGVDNAKKINELNMCLEEYIEYLKNL